MSEICVCVFLCARACVSALYYEIYFRHAAHDKFCLASDKLLIQSSKLRSWFAQPMFIGNTTKSDINYLGQDCSYIPLMARARGADDSMASTINVALGEKSGKESYSQIRRTLWPWVSWHKEIRSWKLFTDAWLSTMIKPFVTRVVRVDGEYSNEYVARKQLGG